MYFKSDRGVIDKDFNAKSNTAAVEELQYVESYCQNGMILQTKRAKIRKT